MRFRDWSLYFSPQDSPCGSPSPAGERPWHGAAALSPPSARRNSDMAEWLEPAPITDMLRTSLRLTIPIAFAAMGGVLSERSGVYNIGLEGMILGGAFGAALGTFVTGSPVGGVIFGMLLGMLAALVLGILAIYFAVNQIVCGIAINLVVIGLTAFLARLIFGLDATTQTLPGFS